MALNVPVYNCLNWTEIKGDNTRTCSHMKTVHSSVPVVVHHMDCALSVRSADEWLFAVKEHEPNGLSTRFDVHNLVFDLVGP